MICNPCTAAMTSRFPCTLGEVSSMMRGVSASSARAASTNSSAPSAIAEEVPVRRPSTSRKMCLSSSMKQVTFPLDVIFDSAVRAHDVDEVASLLQTLAPAPTTLRARSASDSSASDLCQGRWFCPVDINAPCRRLGLTALHLCCLRGRLDCVRVLVAGGANCNVRDKRGWTPLHVAAWAGHVDIVRLLLECGAECKAQARSGLRPVDVAKEEETASLLRGTSSSDADTRSDTPGLEVRMRSGTRRNSVAF